MAEVTETLGQSEAFWAGEFARISRQDDFVDFFCKFEDQWLQYADWDEKIPAIFGGVRNAVIEFRLHCSESATGFQPPPE